MTKKPGRLFLVLSLLLLFSPAILASNTAEEARILAEIRDQLKQGEIVELQASGQQFIGIYQKSALPVTLGGVLILHGLNQNPDSPAVIRPLRNRLTKSGWNTLSIQMPVPSMDSSGNLFPELEAVYPALATEAAARITAAANYFEEREISNLAVVAHGLGANMAISYLSGNAAKKFQALVTISMNHNQPGNFAESLSQLKLPVIDIYGSRDIKAIVTGAATRKEAITVEAENSYFRQSMIEGADHYYSGLEPELLSTVRAWLKKTSPLSN